MTAMTVDELKAAFAALPPTDPVEPEHSWRFWAWDLRQNVAKNDPREFLTWPGLTINMYVGNAPYIRDEYDFLPLDYLKFLKSPDFGGATDRIGGRCTNMVHQAYHLYQADKFIPELETIIEIGGGYGAMALVCHRLGFRGRYIIYDLPEFGLLQQYYLSNCGIEGVEFKSEITESMNCDLLIGLYSLSEMPLLARNAIMMNVRADSYLLAYMSSWGGYDNARWAGGLMRQKGYLWRNWNIPHLPNCWYLIGDRL